MAKPALANITTSQTFQNWFDKTNELVNLFKSDAVTASGSGDTTIGNATLNGNFTSTNLIASTLLSSDTVASRTAGATIQYQSPIRITGTSGPIVATFNFGASGGRTRYTDGNISWDVGMENSAQANFIIDTGVAPVKFRLTPAGTLTVPNMVVSQTLTVQTLNATTITGGSVDLSGKTTNDLSEGSNNLYYTTARANAAIDARVNQAFVNALGITASNSSSLGGVAASAYLRNNQSGTLTGTLTIIGELLVTGDITTEHSVSDIKLKENLKVIDGALDKVNQISGYTFNYINDEEKKRTAGLLAQEIEKVLPEVVYEFQAENDKAKAIRYGNIVALLVEAIKELKTKVDELEKNKCACDCGK